MLGAACFICLILSTSTGVLGKPDASKDQLTLTLPQAPDVISPAREPLFQAPDAGPVLVMTLLGSALAVMSNLAPAFAAESANERIDYESPATTYARNVAAFEHKVERRIKGSVSAARKSARRASKVFRNNLREAAGRGFGAVRSGVNGISRMADRSMRNFARATTNGFRRLGGATYNGVERAGHGAGSRIARVGTAARLGLSRMTDAYRRSFSRAGYGILGVGSAATKGFSNVAKTYMRGIHRLGIATSRLGEASPVSKRMGEADTDDTEVAGSTTEETTSLVNDRKLQDCLLQTMCYVSSPFLTGDRTQRQRMLRSMANFGDDASAALDDADSVAVLHERQNDVADNSIDVKLDDCDVFKCELASLGRKAYNLVTELREASRRRR